MSIHGVVEAVSKKEVKTKFGMKPTFAIKVDGEWYSCGFTDPRAGSGDEVTFEFTAGRYGNEIDKGTLMRTGSGKPVPAPAVADNPAPAPKSAPTRPFPIPALHGDRAIIRQNALAHAARLYAAGISPATASSHSPESLAAEVIAMARKFEAYSCGDLDAAQAAAKLVEKELAKAN